MKLRQQSTATYPIPFLMVSSSDHVSPVTGITPVVTISKNGAAFASPSGAVSEVGSGWYILAGNATDRNTIGELLIHATGTGADPTDERYLVVPFDPFDATALGLTRLDAAITSRAAAGDAMTLTAAYDPAKTAAQAGDQMALTAAAIDLIHDEAVEGTITLRQATRLIIALARGLATGGGTTAIAYRDQANTKDRITMTVDANGNRTVTGGDLS